MRVKELMTPYPITVPPETSVVDARHKRNVFVVDPDRDASEAACLMVAEKIGALPVIYGGELVGILTETDFLGAFVAATAAGRTD